MWYRRSRLAGARRLASRLAIRKMVLDRRYTLKAAVISPALGNLVRPFFAPCSAPRPVPAIPSCLHQVLRSTYATGAELLSSTALMVSTILCCHRFGSLPAPRLSPKETCGGERFLESIDSTDYTSIDVSIDPFHVSWPTSTPTSHRADLSRRRCQHNSALLGVCLWVANQTRPDLTSRMLCAQLRSFATLQSRGCMLNLLDGAAIDPRWLPRG